MTAAARLAALAAALLAVACAGLPDPDFEREGRRPARGAVVSEHRIATDVGLEVLRQGGNAADAAIATALALAVVYPRAGNLGGGGFAIWVGADPEEPPAALDFRETAPMALRPEDFVREGQVDRELARSSGLGVGVPGTPHGLWALHVREGSIDFEDLARPAIDLARQGFRVDPWMAWALSHPEWSRRLASTPEGRRTFYPEGRPLRAGELLRQPELADAIERLARYGPRGFYDGPIAEALVAAVREHGGRMTLADLRRYRPRWREPLRTWFRGREIVAMPPPSSGGVVLAQVLAILSGFPLDAEHEATRAEDGTRTGLSARALHWWIEAMRRAFADRARNLGDPEFHDVPVEDLLASEWISQRRISIGERADPTVEPWSPAAADGAGETTHLCTLDDEGNAVSLTFTLNFNYGSGIVVPGWGFLLNNELDDFALAEGVPNEYGLVGGEANAVEPGKRPLSSMTPLVVRQTSGEVAMVLGSPGGPRIITALLQVLLRVLVYEETLPDAIAAPRVHQQWQPPETSVEPGWDAPLLRGLEARGHALVVRPDPYYWASVQAIRVGPEGEPEVWGDPRRGGSGGLQGGRASEPSVAPDALESAPDPEPAGARTERALRR